VGEFTLGEQQQTSTQTGTQQAATNKKCGLARSTSPFFPSLLGYKELI